MRNEALFRMADGTGGGFYQNFNQAGEAFDKILERTSGEYLLALTVSGPAGRVRSTSRIPVVVPDSTTDP